ncbi:MAG TPA: hypothetical protein VL094_00035 [Sphingomonadaceae bacterium]|nr:hypothetical protein [Sphingomonadaceae bacterium]
MGGELAVLQAPMVDGLSLDPFTCEGLLAHFRHDWKWALTLSACTRWHASLSKGRHFFPMQFHVGLGMKSV